MSAIATTTATTLKSLFQTIDANIKSGSGTINLVPDVLSTDAIGSFYKELIPSSVFEITNAALEPAVWDDSLKEFTLTGASGSFGIGDMSVFMIFNDTDAGILSNLTLLLNGATWYLEGIDWFGLSDPFVGIQVYYGGLPVVGTTGGSIKLSPLVNLTLQMSYPIVEDIWLLQGKLTAPYPSISNFYQLLGGVNLSAALPQPFSTLTDLGLQEIDVKYDSLAKNITYISADIATSEDYVWQILPKLAVTNIGINCVVLNPGNSQTRKTSFTINGNFTIGPEGSNNLVVTATVPNFSALVQLDSGTIQLGDLLTMFWDGVTVDLKSEITTFSLQIDPAAKNYSLNCGIKSDWTFLKLPMPKVDFTMKGMSLEVASQQGKSSGKFTGLFNIGADPDTKVPGVDITLSAGYDDGTWNFAGKTGTGQSISLVDIAYTFLKPFGIGEIPSWVSNGNVALNISDVSFSALVPPSSANKPNTYKVGGTVLWQLNFSSFNLSLKAVVDITFNGNNTSGKITGTTKLLGLKFDIGYEFSSGKTNEIYLQWEGIRASYTHNDEKKQDIFAVKFTKMSLGDIISHLMKSIIPGFELSSPWSLLNSINLDGLSFTYTKNIEDSTQDTIVISYNSGVDLGFLKISSILLTKDKDGVHLGFEGTFLGLAITAGDPTTGALAGKGSKVNEMPAVPGMGDSAFDLKFLALGQHVELANSSTYNTVDDAVTAMKDSFKDTNDAPNAIPIKAGSGPLVFNQNSDWLIGADFTVAQFYRMAFVFNDPNLYGLVIGVSDKAQFLKNLQFEILYKKVNDSIGVYQIELQLPDIFRHLEFGQVSITLPNIGLKIYTNGNFYIDLGWPASMTDFSRSFTLQIFPFIGSGGFYFASLTGATATGLPVVQKGVFNPVIEAGIALSVGVGKTIEAGILKAGLSLTAVGIFQGTYALFTPNPNTPYTGQTDTYYKFSGTMALVGRIYGEVNFAIISASLDITAYIQLSFILEAYKAIPIVFQAGVSVRLTVKINLGLFKISVGLSFSATITASFIIGSDRTQQSLWYKVDHNNMLARHSLYLPSQDPVTLKWQPVVIDTGETFGLDLYFAPHLTISGETLTSSGQIYTPGPQYVGMLYIDTGSTNPGSFTQFGMNALATGALYWAANAIVGSAGAGTKLSWLKDQEITIDQINQLLCYIQTRPDNAAPFNYKNGTGNDIESFLKAFFTVQVSAIDANVEKEISAAVFPVFPELQMQTELNGTKGTLVDFSIQSMTGNQNYVSDISNLLKSLSVAYESAATASHYSTTDCQNVTDPDYENQPDLSMPTFIFSDFIALTIKQLLQNAQDYFKSQNVSVMKVSDLVTGVVKQDNVSQLSGMASRFMLHGLRLPQPPVAATGQIQPLYVLTGQQWTVPAAIKTDDKYVVNLMNTNASWIKFINGADNNLQVTFSPDDIQRVINLRTNVLNPSVKQGYPKPLDNINNMPQSFSLGGNVVWNYPGDFFAGSAIKPTLWKTPSNFRNVLQNNTNNSLNFNLETLTPEGDATTKGAITNYKWATMLNVSLQKIAAQDLLDTPLSGNVYTLTGADDASISLLEDIIVYMNKDNGKQDNFIEQVQILMKPDPATGQAGLISALNGDLNTAIIQANLSTDTNPNVQSKNKKSLVKGSQYNTLNKPGNFITLLWECSIVRSGGFYFYYITPQDGKGLPDYLFGESGTADIQLVVTYHSFIPKPFINAVITGDDLDFSKTAVYAQSPDITVPVPTLMPGNVGYELSRINPGEFDPTQNPPTAPEDQVYLQNQFNLLGVSLPAVSVYKNYMPAGPVDPLSQDELQNRREGKLTNTNADNDWNYSSVIPYYKFAQSANDDKDYPNPYAGIGTHVQMALNWQDMFGNMPATDVASLSVSMQMLYTDTIVSVSQWPSVSAFYLFDDKGNGPELDINFIFDISKYNDGTPGALNNAEIDLETYMKLYYQLVSGDMVMQFSSTIEGTEATPAGMQQNIEVNILVQNFISPIIAYLKGILMNTSPVAVAPYSLSALVNVNSIAAYADSIPLTVAVKMERTKNVDPDFADAPGVASAVTMLKPQAQESLQQAAQDEALGLSYFAQLFEKAFTDKPSKGILIKIATASDGDDITNDADSAARPIWIVRFDSTGANGIKYVYDNSKVYFFAPVPLATSLVSIDTPVNAYQTGKDYPVGSPVNKKFSAIDLDDWGKMFLEAVDSFLAPGLAVPAFLLDNGASLKEMLDQKETLAEAIEGTITYIIDAADKSGANIGNAQEKWKQEILKELSATYKYSAAIQTPVDISSSYTGSNSYPADGVLTTPKLYGNIQGNDPSIPDEGKTIQASTEYSLSTSKLPLASGKSWLTYMFESKDTAEFRNFKFGNMQFKASHLEQQIHAVDGIDGYTASNWLTFILPLDASLSDVGEIIIPVPLRAYPTPPSVTAQTLNYNTPQNLQEARAWDFIYSYKNAIAAQDTIETQIEFNIPGDTQNRVQANPGDITLDEALAQFIEVYPQIAADFKTYLSNLTQKDVQDATATYTNALYAVKAFKAIVQSVAIAWMAWNQINPRKPKLMNKMAKSVKLAEPIVLNFTVVETGAKDTGYLNIKVLPAISNTLPQVLEINIPGYKLSPLGNNTYAYTDGNDAYLTYEDRNKEPLRNVAVKGLDILNTQNAWGGAQIVRNQDLLPDSNGGWQTTTKEFLYQTPLVKFYTKLTALLNCTTPIDISAIDTKSYPAGKRSLDANMHALFEALTDGVDAGSLSIKLTVSYTYNLADNKFPVTVPVYLVSPFDLSTSDKGSSFAATLTENITTWLSQNIASDAKGTFGFEINVFSSLDANTLLFRLPLFLNM